MVAAPITAASPETPARMRARPQLRRVLVGGGGGLSLRTTWGDAAQLPGCVLETPAALQDQEGLPGGHLGVAPPEWLRISKWGWV